MAAPFSTVVYITADTQVVATGTRVSLLSSILFPGSLGLAQADLKSGGSGGATIFHQEASLGVTPCSWTSGAPNAGAEFADGLYVNLTGTGATVQLEYLVSP